jgi:hypothetical protein
MILELATITLNENLQLTFYLYIQNDPSPYIASIDCVVSRIQNGEMIGNQSCTCRCQWVRSRDRTPLAIHHHGLPVDAVFFLGVRGVGRMRSVSQKRQPGNRDLRAA